VIDAASLRPVLNPAWFWGKSAAVSSVALLPLTSTPRACPHVFTMAVTAAADALLHAAVARSSGSRLSKVPSYSASSWPQASSVAPMASCAADWHVSTAGEFVAVDGGAPVEVAKPAIAVESLLRRDALSKRFTGMARVWNIRLVTSRASAWPHETYRAEDGEGEDNELDGDHDVRQMSELRHSRVEG
jgi:hypothetical protein